MIDNMYNFDTEEVEKGSAVDLGQSLLAQKQKRLAESQKEQEKLKHLSQFDEQAKMKYLDVQKEAALKEAEALGAQKEELLRIEQEFADRKN